MEKIYEWPISVSKGSEKPEPEPSSSQNYNVEGTGWNSDLIQEKRINRRVVKDWEHADLKNCTVSILPNAQS